jgi:sugar (pentulose or hexulose) kinase
MTNQTPATKYILGIDGGSQSSKAVIFDTDGRVICEASQALVPMYTPEPGVAEHPDDDLYDSIVIAVSRVLEVFEGNPADIVGVGLCTIRCCRALTRADGTLAAPVQSWMDARLDRPYEANAAEANAAEANSGEGNADEVATDDVAYVTTTSGYLMGRLTGELTDTVANYIGPWPMDVQRWDWFADEERFDSFNVSRRMLYRLQMPGDIGGHVTEAFAASTGIPVGLPVVHTANDKAAEALGAGLRDEETGLVSLGTYIAGMVVGKEYVASPQTYFANFASEPHRYLYESAGIRRGMWTVSWLLKLFGSEITTAAEAAGLSPEQYLNVVAAEVPAGSDGLMCVLDWLAPPAHPFRKGMFLGFDERHGYAHMYRAILEAIAFTMKRNMTAMQDERGTRIERLVVSGGGSFSDLGMQIMADAFQVPVLRNQVRNSAGLGAAICVAVACGVYPTFDEASRRMVHREDIFTPDALTGELYEQLGSISSEITAHTDSILERSHDVLLRHRDGAARRTLAEPIARVYP